MRASTLFLSIFVFIIFISCKKEKPQKEAAYPLETARMVAKVTSGMIGTKDVVRVGFVSEMVPAELVGIDLKKEVFHFNPSMEGQTYWKDRQTLVFKPNKPWPFRQSYQGKLDIKALFPKQAGKKVTPLIFQFRIAGREVQNFKADFELADQENPKYLIFKGTITFTQPTPVEVLKKVVRCILSSKKIKLTWQAASDGKSFYFHSDPILRSAGAKTLSFFVPADKLDLSTDFKRVFTLPALSALTVNDIIVESRGDRPQLKIEFSEGLNPQQNLEGLISLRPSIPLKIKIMGKFALLRGNFEYGKSYALKILPGVRSRWGTRFKKQYSETIVFEDILPELRFANKGVFLPSGNQQKIMFQTVNVRRVDLKIIKVFDNNLGQFLQMENLDGAKKRSHNFGYEMNRVGVVQIKKSLYIGEERNRWLQHELDLQKLIRKDSKGLYLIKISFTKKDMLYDTSENNLQYRKHHYDYYNDPASYGYIYSHGQIFKPIIVSDIGLTGKQAGKDYLVFATDLLSSKPLSGVEIKLFTYQNQIIARSTTDVEGTARFENVSQKVFYISGEKSGQRSALKPENMRWNISTFDTKGVEEPEGGLRAYIYTERGVYRPGDTLNISAIIRNEQKTFPAGHPVQLIITNPRNQKVYDRINKSGKDGFYHFVFSTEPNALTGTYRAKVKVGSQTFYHNLKIEMVVPERLKIKLTSDKKVLKAGDHQLHVSLQSNYLFGNPAAHLNAEMSILLFPVRKTFKTYHDFMFYNEAAQFQQINEQLFKGKLDGQGKVEVRWPLPDMTTAPAAVQAVISAKVFEKGGRSSKQELRIPIDPYTNYVGLKRPRMRYWYAKTGQELHIPVVLLNRLGEIQPGRTLHYRIYRNQQHWWWEYDSRREYHLRYKKDQTTMLVKEGNLLSGRSPVFISYTPEERGQYLIEVQEAVPHGHSAGFFISAYPWGSAPAEGKQAGTLALSSDKTKYFIGDKATISFPVSPKGSILMTIEKGHHILKSQWYEADGKSDEKTITFPVNKEMVPNAYVTVSVIQPQPQTSDDRPIRMYGVVPLLVEDPSTHQELSIHMADELKAGQKFKVRVQTADHRPTQLTIAVVDEGLLSLTRFRTPDPWQSFFSKIRLSVLTSDLFNQVIGINRGDIFKTFSIGGGISAAEEYRQGQLPLQKVRRFKPVSLFSGPLQTDSNGKVSATFTMPEYVGAVRVMVVSARGNRYGHAEKSVPVKKELMLLPTLPRVVGPGDRFVLPVTVFAMKDGLGKVDISLRLEGPLTVLDSTGRSLFFKKSSERDVRFSLQAINAVGAARVEIVARAGKLTSKSVTDLVVRASAPRIRKSFSQMMEPGQTISLSIPNDGLPGSNRARVSILRRPHLKLTHRILWLIRYPYGCIEQTVSTVFPQLYLQDFIPKSRAATRDIDKNINLGIQRLQRFQLPSGAFSYWPGGKRASFWATIYAAHFLTEASQAGYHVPDNLLTNWRRFLKYELRNEKRPLTSRVFGAYVLAEAGQADFGVMNILRENDLNKFKDVQRWLLAAAYKYAGVDETADQIARNAGSSVADYKEFAGTYGSGLRDKALILEQMLLFKRWEDANRLADELATALSSGDWYSTQTTGYMLLALGKYFHALEGETSGPKRIAGKIILPGGKHFSFDTDKISFEVPIAKGFGKQVQVYLDPKSTLKKAFVNLEWSGVPKHYTGQNLSKNISLKVDWLDEDGMPVHPEQIKQGTTFWAHFRVGKPRSYRSRIDEIALVQVLPAGWEIENTRLSGENQPEWMRKWRVGREEYQDIRDDRVMWFFDLDRYQYFMDFVVKLNAVTQGEFFLPPTLAEAMYNHSYRAEIAGKTVKVLKR